VIVLSGNTAWAESMARQMIHNLNLDAVLWISHRSTVGDTPIANSQLTTKLGQETTHIVFDMFAGFNPKLFTTVSGTLKAGGVFIILCPSFAQWPKFSDPFYMTMHQPILGTNEIPGLFLKRFIEILKSQKNCFIMKQEEKQDLSKAIEITEAKLSTQSTFEQQETVFSIVESIKMHNQCVQVIISNRGRGKSSALGIIAAALMQQESMHIVITGPRFSSVQTAFLHLKKNLSHYTDKTNVVTLRGASFRYQPPDQLCWHKNLNVDILIVDEAAAIPLPLLSSLLNIYPKIIFSTTLDGYEGTGQGFGVQFTKTLNKKTPGWNKYVLKTPIRWSQYDPLEQLINKTFLLDATTINISKEQKIESDKLSIIRIKQFELVDNEKLLIQIYSLLRAAHYRTTPTDLRNIIDSPGVDIFVVKHKFTILAVALVSREGEIPAGLAKDIYQGKRRIRGHLAPQSLVYHCGFKLLARFKYARIMRIVTHPGVQRRGIGKKLYAAVETYYKQLSYDYMAVSFGLRDSLIEFWVKSELEPVKLSVTQDHSSGSYSLLMLKSLTLDRDDSIQKLTDKFIDSLSYVIKEFVHNNKGQLLEQLKCYIKKNMSYQLSKNDFADIDSFISGYRSYEVNCFSIFKYVFGLNLREDSCVLSTHECKFLTMKIIDNASWANIVCEFNLSGKKQAINYLRTCLKKSRISELDI